MPADPTLDEQIAAVRAMLISGNAKLHEQIALRAVLATLEASRPAPLPDGEPPAMVPNAEERTADKLQTAKLEYRAAGYSGQPFAHNALVLCHMADMANECYRDGWTARTERIVGTRDDDSLWDITVAGQRKCHAHQRVDRPTCLAERQPAPQPGDADRLAPVDEQMKALASCIAFAEHNVDSWWEYPESEAGLSARRHLAGLRGVLGRLSELTAAQSALAESQQHATMRYNDWRAVTAELAETKVEVARLTKILDEINVYHRRDTDRLRSPTATGEDADDQEWWLDLVEKDDRTSPEEYPDMALITRDEFIAYRAAARAQGVREGIEQAVAILRRLSVPSQVREAVRALGPEPQEE